MTDANSLPYYPRFIFNCNDGVCISTGDLENFKFIKEKGSEYDITSFRSGQKIEISLDDGDKQEIKSYVVDKIEIQQLKYDLDEPTYGLNRNDCVGRIGKDKKWMMEIYVFLKAL
jgi:hypothetical protein